MIPRPPQCDNDENGTWRHHAHCMTQDPQPEDMAASTAREDGYSRHPTVTREQVLREAADTADRIAKTHLAFGDIQTGRGADHVARRLRHMAARHAETTTVPAASPDFFQPGHTYRLGHRHAFRCTAVDANPSTGERHAIGWAYDRQTGRWRVTDLTSANWRGGWTETTEDGGR